MAGNENERLVVFCDAVIAITITLLVLELSLPESPGPLSDAALWQAILDLRPRLTGYVISFLVIAVFWLGHREKFAWIVRSSNLLLWLNLGFLLGISWMPFVTDLLVENGGRLATILYAALTMSISLLGAAMSWHAVRAGLTADTHRDLSAWRMAWPSLSTAVVFALSIPLALWSPSAAQYFWIVLFPLHRFADARIAPDLVRAGTDPAP